MSFQPRQQREQLDNMEESSDFQSRLQAELDYFHAYAQSLVDQTQGQIDAILNEDYRILDLTPNQKVDADLRQAEIDLWLIGANLTLQSRINAVQLVENLDTSNLADPYRYIHAIERLFTLDKGMRVEACRENERELPRVYLMPGATQWFLAGTGSSRIEDNTWIVNLSEDPETGKTGRIKVHTMFPSRANFADLEEICVMGGWVPTYVYALPNELKLTEEVTLAYSRARQGGTTKEAAISAVVGAVGPEALSRDVQSHGRLKRPAWKKTRQV